MHSSEYYSTSILSAFSEYLRLKDVSVVKQYQAKALFKFFLQWKTHPQSWDPQEVTAFLEAEKRPHSFASELIEGFLREQPPLQSKLLVKNFILALKRAECSDVTVRNYRSDINQFIAFSGVTTFPELLTKNQILNFVRFQHEKGLKNSSITRKLASITRLGLWAKEQGLFLNEDLAWITNLNIDSLLAGELPTEASPATTPIITPATTPATPVTPAISATSAAPETPSATQVVPEPLPDIDPVGIESVPQPIEPFLTPSQPRPLPTPEPENLAYLHGLSHHSHEPKSQNSWSTPSDKLEENETVLDRIYADEVASSKSYAWRKTKRSQGGLKKVKRAAAIALLALLTWFNRDTLNSLAQVIPGLNQVTEPVQTAWAKRPTFLGNRSQSETRTPESPTIAQATKGRDSRILGIADDLRESRLAFNIITIFREAVNIESSLSVTGDTTLTNTTIEGTTTLNDAVTINAPVALNADMTGDGVTIDVGTGEVLASNLIYSITAGDGITITGDQELTIAAEAVNSFANIKVEGTTLTASGDDDTITFLAGDGITLSTSGKEVTIATQTVATPWQETGTTVSLVTASNKVGIGTASPTAKTEIIATSEQLRLGYDASNYAWFDVASDGTLTLAATNEIIFDDANLTSTVKLSEDDTALFGSETGIIDAINAAYAAATGGGGGTWSKTTTFIHPTTLTDSLAVGGDDASAPFHVNSTGNIIAATDETINGVDIIAGAISDVTTLVVNDSISTTDLNASGTVTIGSLNLTGTIFSSSGNLSITPSGSLTLGSETYDTNIVGDSITFNDSNLSTAIPFTLNDNALNASLSQGIVDALNDLYSLSSGGGGSSGYFSKAAGAIYPTTTTDNISIGTSSNVAKLGVVGDGDEVQLLVRANSTQTSDIFQLQTSAPATLLSVANNGNISFAPTAFGSAITLYDTDVSFDSSDTGIIDAINTAYNAATGSGGAGLWTITSGVVYLTTPSQDFALGGSTLSDSSLGLDVSTNTLYLGTNTNANPALEFTATDSDTGTFGFNTNDAFYFSGANVGVGTTNPSALFAVGSSSEFQVDTAGAISAATDETINGIDINAGAISDVTSITASGTITGNVVTANSSIDVGNLTLSGSTLASAGNLLFTDTRATAIPLTAADTAINANLTQGLVDALNDLYDLQTSGGASAIWTRDDANDYTYLSNATDKLGLGTSTPTANLHVYSTQTSLGANGLGYFNWQPSSAATLTGDLFALNIGTNASINGNIFNILDNGSSLFSVSESKVSSNLPVEFNSPGNVGIAYDLVMTNQTASAIRSYGPMTLEAGESFESNDLTLKTYNSGDLVADIGGNLVLASADPAIIFDTVTGTDTDFWMGVTEDAGGDDDDVFQIGDGTVLGTNPFLTINTSGNVGIGTTSPNYPLHVSGSGNFLRLENPSIAGADFSFLANGFGLYINDIDNSSTTRLLIERNSGNIGIGVASSTDIASKLVVNGSASIGTSYTTTAAPTNGLLVEGNVGIGTTSPTSGLLQIVDTTTGIGVHSITSASSGTSTTLSGVYGSASTTGTAGGPFVTGVHGNLSYAGSSAISNAAAGYFTSLITGAAPTSANANGLFTTSSSNLPASSVTGVRATATANNSTGTVGTAAVFYAPSWGTTNAGSTTTNAYGLRLGDISNSGTITNTYGVHVGDITTGTQTNTPYSFYASDSNAYNYFAGNVGIGSVTAPSERLSVQSTNDGATYATQIRTTGTGRLLALRGTGSNGWINMLRESDGAGLGRMANGTISGTANALLIEGASGVGLGTTSSTYSLWASANQVRLNQTGSAGTPSLAFSGDQDTGLFGTDANVLGFTTGGTERMRIDTNGYVGIGTTSPTANLNVTTTATTLTTNGLGYFNWQPSSAASFSGDLFALNVGSNGTVNGNIFNVLNNGSSLFSVSQSKVTSNLPVEFAAAGDVSMAYNLNLTNQTASYINSNAPLYLVAGESFESNNLTLQTYNSGNIVLQTGGSANIIASDPSIIFTPETATDTRFWAGVIEDAGADDDDVFQIGDGSVPGTNPFVTVTTAGNVGIGTTSPSTTLYVKSTGTDDVATFESDNNTSCTLSTGGVISCTSDENLKKNIADLGSSLDLVNQLRPVTFNWKSQTDGDTKVTGFIAQEVEAVLPELVSTSANGYKSLSQVGLIPYLVQALQDQQTQIQSLSLNQQQIKINNTSGTDLVDLKSDDVTKLKVTNDGKLALGIGNEVPAALLQVRGTQAASSAAILFNQATDAEADGLEIKLGATTLGTGNSFVTFKNGAGEVAGAITANETGGVTYATEGQDFAEYFLKANLNEDLTPGTIVCLSELGVTACNGSLKPLGVVSDRAGFVGGISQAGDPRYILVGLMGQLPVTIDETTTEIKAGDFITMGKNGTARKATSAGYVIGKALSSSANSTQLTVVLQPMYYIGDLSNEGTLLATSPVIEISQLETETGSNPASTEVSGTTLATQDQLELLNLAFAGLQTDVASLSAELANMKEVTTSKNSSTDSPTLSADQLAIAFSDSLFAAGIEDLDTSLAINKPLLIGDLTIMEDSIDSAQTLKLQSFGVAGIELVAGKVTIAKDGSVTVLGNLAAKTITTEKLTIGSITEPQVATTSAVLGIGTEASSSGLIATPSANIKTSTASIGTATLKAGSSQVTIKTTAVSEHSRLFTTPRTKTGGQILVVDNIDPATNSITVTIEQPITTDLTFDWWIVDAEE